jgi:hypothetical protein
MNGGKMNTKAVVRGEWPKLRVEYFGDKPSEILTVQQAVERFGMDESDFSWLNDYTAGTSINHAKRNNRDVYMVRRYTLEDSIRDAAPALLAQLKVLAAAILAMNNNDRETRRSWPELRDAEAAIAKAEGKS